MKIMIQEPSKKDRGHRTQKIKYYSQRLCREHPSKPPYISEEREFKEASPLPEVTQLIGPAH